MQNRNMTNSILDLILAPWKISVLFTAIRLNLFTILSNDSLPVDEIASKCNAIPHTLKPLLDACVSMGLLILQDDKYMNSHFSRVYFIEREPQYLGDLVKLHYNESKQWDKLYDIIIENKKRGEDEAEFKERTFIKAMHNLGMLGEANVLSNVVDISGCKQMVDAGGGSGLYSIVLCRRYPELNSTILDRNETLKITKEMIEDYEERERITLHEADLEKDSYGKNIDVVLLSDVIYDERIASSILRNAWNCLRQDGFLILRGYYSDPDNSKPLFGALFVLGQLVFDSNRKIITIPTLQRIVKDAGFNLTKISPLTERSHILIAKKTIRKNHASKQRTLCNKQG